MWAIQEKMCLSQFGTCQSLKSIEMQLKLQLLISTIREIHLMVELHKLRDDFLHAKDAADVAGHVAENMVKALCSFGFCQYVDDF